MPVLLAAASATIGTDICESTAGVITLCGVVPPSSSPTPTLPMALPAEMTKPPAELLLLAAVLMLLRLLLVLVLPLFLLAAVVVVVITGIGVVLFPACCCG